MSLKHFYHRFNRSIPGWSIWWRKAPLYLWPLLKPDIPVFTPRLYLFPYDPFRSLKVGTTDGVPYLDVCLWKQNMQLFAEASSHTSMLMALVALHTNRAAYTLIEALVLPCLTLKGPAILLRSIYLSIHCIYSLLIYRNTSFAYQLTWRSLHLNGPEELENRHASYSANVGISNICSNPQTSA